MIRNVTFFSFPQVYSAYQDHSKIVHTAILALGLFVFTLIYFSRASGSVSISPKNPELKKDSCYPGLLIQVLGGREKFNAIPLISIDLPRPEIENPSNLQKLQEITKRIEQCDDRDLSPAMKGKDPWGCPLVVLRSKEKDASSQKIIMNVIYCMDPKGENWYINQWLFGKALAQLMSFIKKA